MSPAQSNRFLLDFWAGAYAAFGEAALPPLGLSPADIDAVLTVEPTVLRHWAKRSDSIVRPRPGLLPALQAQDRDRIATFLISGCENGPATTLLPRRANRHLLTVWRHANGDDEQAGHMALSSDDRAALAVVDELAWHRWIRLPITLAEPCPGLLPDLLAREEPQLVAFLDSLQR